VLTKLWPALGVRCGLYLMRCSLYEDHAQRAYKLFSAALARLECLPCLRGDELRGHPGDSLQSLPFGDKIRGGQLEHSIAKWTPKSKRRHNLSRRAPRETILIGLPSLTGDRRQRH